MLKAIIEFFRDRFTDEVEIVEEEKPVEFGYFIIAQDVNKFYIEKRVVPYDNRKYYDREVYGTYRASGRDDNDGKRSGKRETRDGKVGFWDTSTYGWYWIDYVYFVSADHAKLVIDKYIREEAELMAKRKLREDFIKAHPPERYP